MAAALALMTPFFSVADPQARGGSHAPVPPDGLKNSDDQGTRFDLLAEVLRNGVPIASGEVYCITGVTRNPANPHVFNFGAIEDADFGPADVFSLRVSARIGTDGNGVFCGGHANAVGLRLYFDAASRPAQFEVTFEVE
jgi:hypothetical protein